MPIESMLSNSALAALYFSGGSREHWFSGGRILGNDMVHYPCFDCVGGFVWGGNLLKLS